MDIDSLMTHISKFAFTLLDYETPSNSATKNMPRK